MTELVERYLELQLQRQNLLSGYRAAEKILASEIERLEEQLLSEMNATEVQRLNGSSGYVHLVNKKKFNCVDWDEFSRFVIDQRAPQLFARYLHQSNLKKFIASNKTGELPEGIEEISMVTLKAVTGEKR
jgi:hypothetical protein